jgi:hypothetical protein
LKEKTMRLPSELEGKHRFFQMTRPDVLVLQASGNPAFLVDPTHCLSDEESLVPYTPDFEIDRVLGIYLPDKREAKVFSHNVQLAAVDLECNAEILSRIVYVHEMAHAALHLGVSGDERVRTLRDPKARANGLRELGQRLNSISSFVNEQLTQLITLNSIRLARRELESVRFSRLGAELENTFFKLMKSQRSLYDVRAKSGWRGETTKNIVGLILRRKIPTTDEVWKSLVEMILEP